MTGNSEIITAFYAAFSRHDADAMSACYHLDVVFHDPVFGTLNGRQVSDMWKMLIERSNRKLDVNFFGVKSNGNSGSAQWEARYVFGKTGRKVLNRVKAEFRFKDGLIIDHKDDFNFWKWSQQALGPTGLLFGWSPMLRDKVRRQARLSLKHWQQTKI